MWRGTGCAICAIGCRTSRPDEKSRVVRTASARSKLPSNSASPRRLQQPSSPSSNASRCTFPSHCAEVAPLIPMSCALGEHPARTSATERRSRCGREREGMAETAPEAESQAEERQQRPSPAAPALSRLPRPAPRLQPGEPGRPCAAGEPRQQEFAPKLAILAVLPGLERTRGGLGSWLDERHAPEALRASGATRPGLRPSQSGLAARRPPRRLPCRQCNACLKPPPPPTSRMLLLSQCEVIQEAE